jgi:dTDP-4-dehydrorhamnose reductase
MIAVFGSDSKIGRHLTARLGSRSISFSRRKTKTDDLYFDLEDIEQLRIDNLNIEIAVICAGITNIQTCEENPRLSFKVNCKNTISLIEKLNDLNVPVLILSSNSIFGQYSKAPDESKNNYAPTCTYALHKSVIDDYLIKNFKKNIIVRITKVVCLEGIFADIIESINQKKKIHLFDNLNLSPISMRFLVDSLIKIIDSKKCGVFHLSGINTCTYYKFGLELEKVLSSPMSRASNVLSTHQDQIGFLPIEAGLEMRRTIEELCIEPQNINAVVDDLLAEFRNFNTKS